MKKTTEQYRRAMEQTLRPPSEVQITFQNIDTTATYDGKWTDDGHAKWSDSAIIAVDHQYGPAVCTTERNRCIFGDDFYFPESADQPIADGFVSSSVSAEGFAQSGFYAGELASAEVNYFGEASGAETFTAAKLNRNFSEPHTFPGVTLTFDTRMHEWPRYASISYHGGKSKENYKVVYITGSEQYIPMPAVDITGITIVLWDLIGGRRFRIERILLGEERIFSNDEITTCKQSHDVDPISRRLPKESLSFTVIDYRREYDFENPAGVWRYIDEKAPIEIRYGIFSENGVQWIKEDRYILNGRPSFSNNLVTFQAHSFADAITGSYYKDTIGEKTMYDLATSVLMDIGLPKTDSGVYPWVISESLKSIKTTGILPIQSHMDCLQTIAHASRCKLYTDDSNIFHIEPIDPSFPEKSDFVLSFDSVKEKSQTVSKIPSLRSVRVSVYGFNPEKESTKLYEAKTDSTFLHVEFEPSKSVSIRVSGGSLVSSEIYAQAADLVLSGGEKTVTVTGIPLREQSSVVELTVSKVGEVEEIQNKLITSDSEGKKLAKHIADYLSYRNTYEMDYRGNPELECGDVISIQSVFSDSIPALVLTDEINFNGSLSGHVKIKGLDKGVMSRKS